MSVAWVGAGIAAVGTISQMSSAGSAQDSQSAAAGNATALQKYQYDQTRADNSPFLKNGTAGSNLLSYYLGLNPYGKDQYGTNTNLTGAGGGQASAIDLGNPANGWKPNPDLYANSASYRSAWNSFVQSNGGNSNGMGTTAAYDPSVLQTELAARGFNMDEYNKNIQATAAQNASKDSQYGSLLKPFDANDLAKDVTYNNGLQFGLNEGAKGISRQAAASGSSDSGALQKALTRFGNDYGTTKTEGAYNRYNADQTGIYNKLAGISGAGQTAVNTASASGQNYANNASNIALGLGNARGASSIAQGNALSNGLVNGYNNYQQANLLNSFQNGSNNINYGSGNTGSTNGGYYGGDNSYGSY